MCNIKKYGNEYFTDEKIHFRLGMGTAHFINDVFHVKCHCCFELKEANTENFTADRGKIKTKCKECMKVVMQSWYITKTIKEIYNEQ